MSVYIRPLTLVDKDECTRVEFAAFPPNEAASPEKIEYRLTVCPGICFGLFKFKGSKLSIPLPANIPIHSHRQPSNEEELIAHIISTRSTSKVVRDQDMEVPRNWKADPTAKTEVGHLHGGRTIALHCLAVSPEYQRSGLGKGLMIAYTKCMRDAGETDQIALLTYDRLSLFYQKLGFTFYGKSEATYAGVAWYDLVYEF